jgi:hypothetical protein
MEGLPKDFAILGRRLGSGLASEHAGRSSLLSKLESWFWSSDLSSFDFGGGGSLEAS